MTREGAAAAGAGGAAGRKPSRGRGIILFHSFSYILLLVFCRVHSSSAARSLRCFASDRMAPPPRPCA